MFDHVLDLLLHRHEEQHEPVHQQYRPKHRDVEDWHERHEERDDEGPDAPVPELKLRQPSDERLELLGACRGQCGAVRRGIDLRREEPDDQVEVVYAQAVRHDVVAVQKGEPKDVDHHHHREGAPSLLEMGHGLVQVVLELAVELRLQLRSLAAVALIHAVRRSRVHFTLSPLNWCRSRGFALPDRSAPRVLVAEVCAVLAGWRVRHVRGSVDADDGHRTRSTLRSLRGASGDLAR